MNKHPINEELDFIELFHAVWSARWTITLFPFVAAVLMLIYVLVTDNIYRASVVLAPAESSGAAGLSSLVGQLGGLASLAGVSLPSGQSQTVNAIAILKSQAFVQEFLSQYSGKTILFPERWNKEQATWIKPGFFASGIGALKSALRGKEPTEMSGYASPYEPLDIDAYERFTTEILTVAEDKKSGLITVSVDLNDPKTATDWVESIVAMLNRKMQQEAKAQAQKSIKFLEQELKETSLVEMQRSINQLIEAQVKAKMLASVNEQYAFKVLSPAITPEKQIYPKRALMLFGSIVLGLLIGISAVTFRYYWKLANLSREPGS